MNELDIQIKLADCSDAQAILELQYLAYQSEAAIYDDYSIPPLTQSISEMKADLHNQIVYKAVIGETIGGSVRGYCRDGTCHIGRLVVHPDYQNQGIGSSLMNHIEKHFDDVRRFELFTGARSERNLYLYRKFGYRVYRTESSNEKAPIVFLEKDGNITASSVG